jgi:diacylglycerol kinase (ATP)
MAPEMRKITGVKHIFAAARYSAGGAVRVWTETAFRQEIVSFAVFLVIYAWARASIEIFGAAIILFLVLMAVEALNTAIEEIVDRISPEVSTAAKHAKDLGSFAVFCLLWANGLLLAYAVMSRILA